MATKYLQQLRSFSRDVRLYLISLALANFAFLGIYGVLFNLYILRLGFGPEFIGLLQAASWLPMTIFCIPAGELGGRWGIRRAMIVGLILAVLGFGLLPLAEFTRTSLREGWLLATYSLTGIGAALYFVNAYPFLMGATSSEERGHVFSMQTALAAVAVFIGNLIGGLLPSLFATALAVSTEGSAPYRYPLLIASVFGVPAVLALLMTRDAGKVGTQQAAVEPGPPPLGLITLLALFGLLRVVAQGAAGTFFNVYLDTVLGTSTSLIGALVAVGQVLGALAALVTPLLTARLGRYRTIVLGAVGASLAIVPLALIPHWSAAGLGLVGVITMTSMAYPVFSVYHQEIISPGRRAAMAGAVTTAQSLSWTAVAMVGGYTIKAVGYPALFLIGAGLTMAGALLFGAYFRVPRGEFARDSVLDTTID